MADPRGEGGIISIVSTQSVLLDYKSGITPLFRGLAERSPNFWRCSRTGSHRSRVFYYVVCYIPTVYYSDAGKLNSLLNFAVTRPDQALLLPIVVICIA